MRILILKTGLLLLATLTLLSVIGAFLGSERAAELFNSVPLAIFWIILALLFASAFAGFKSLWTRPGLFMIHFGCLLVLLGGMWGSETGLQIRSRVTGTTTLNKGMFVLHKGSPAKLLYAADGSLLGEFAYELLLNDFEVLYYDEPSLRITDRANPDWSRQIPIQTGEKFNLQPGPVTIEIVRAYNNMRISVEEGSAVATESPEGGENPGYEVLVTGPDGQERHFVFERFAGHAMGGRRFSVQYISGTIVKDYISDLSIRQGEEELIRKEIEVNYPLHFAGFHFYQYMWGKDEKGVYSIIQVVNDSGLRAVFGGYFLLAAGIFIQLWAIPVIRHLKSGRKGCGHGS